MPHPLVETAEGCGCLSGLQKESPAQRPGFRVLTPVPPENSSREISPSTGRRKRGRSGATINRKGIKPMLLQKRHEAAIEVEFVMGLPCPITTGSPKGTRRTPKSPRLRGFFFARHSRSHCLQVVTPF